MVVINPAPSYCEEAPRGRRCWVKGIGIVSPLGQGKAETLTKMREGISAIKKTPLKWGGMAVGEAEEIFLPRKFLSLPRPVQFGYIAMKEAIDDAELPQEEITSKDTGFIFSCSKGDLSALDKGIDKNFWQNLLPHGGAARLAELFNLRGPQFSIVSACASGGQIIARASELLSEGKIKRVIVCASEAPLVPLLLAGYDKMGVLSHSAMRPFDKRRDGFCLGEGGVCLVIAGEGKGRGKISGWGIGASAASPYRFDSDGDALAYCLKELKDKIDFFPDYINTHGTATTFGDLYETRQIKKAFGKDAYKMPISSTKSMTGHLLGASGILEFTLTLLCLRDGFIPFTYGLGEIDPDCDLNFVRDRHIRGDFHKFLTISYGFGGAIACIAGEV